MRAVINAAPRVRASIIWRHGLGRTFAGTHAEVSLLGALVRSLQVVGVAKGSPRRRLCTWNIKIQLHTSTGIAIVLDRPTSELV